MFHIQQANKQQQNLNPTTFILTKTWWLAGDIFRQSSTYGTEIMMLYCFVNSEEHLTSGLCLTPTRNPNLPANILCISVIVGMHRLSFEKYFWLMVFGGRGDMSQTYFLIHLKHWIDDLSGDKKNNSQFSGSEQWRLSPGLSNAQAALSILRSHASCHF